MVQTLSDWLLSPETTSQYRFTQDDVGRDAGYQQEYLSNC